MEKKFVVFAFMCCTIWQNIFSQTNEAINKVDAALVYPQSKKVNTADTFWGKTVKDPYRWLEESDAHATAWMAAQNKMTDKYLSAIPFFSQIKNRITQLWDYPKLSGGFNQNGYTFFYKNEGLLNQSILYRQEKGKEPQIFFDPNQLSADGTTALSSIHFSKDGSMLACQISEKGSDRHKVIVLRTADKTLVEDTLYNIRFSGIVWRGNEGFYYSSYPDTGNDYFKTAQNCRLYFHTVGTAQAADVTLYSDPETPGNMIGISTTSDDRYLVISNSNGLQGYNKLYLLDLSSAGHPIIPVVENFNGQHAIIFNEGSRLFILTTLNAPNKRLIVTDVADPSPNTWKDWIAERKEVLLNVSKGGGKLFGNYLKDAASEIVQFNKNGQYEKTIELPGLGTVAGFAGEPNDTALFYTFTSYTLPVTTFKYNINTGKSTVFKKADEVKNFDPSEYESKRIFYRSKTGVKAPVFITYKKGIQLNGKNPTLLYGYGGFNANLTPIFSIPDVALLEHGFICAVVSLPGGGEYGLKWRKEGMKMNKQNVFNDFIAAAELLISNKYTSRDYLALHGISNGGLLAGAVVSKRPDLFKVALIDVGVLDVVRFNNHGLGALTANEYGTPHDSKQMFEYLMSYSPYYSLKSGKKYPATLIIASDHDDSVTPFWSYKFAARLQQFQPSGAPILLRTQLNVGHGYGKPTSVTIAEQAEHWAFLFYNMGLTWK